MNKRILKLFNEAGFHQPEMERLGIEDKFEKFAELIIKECIEISQVGSITENKLKEHFGVEQ